MTWILHRRCLLLILCLSALGLTSSACAPQPERPVRLRVLNTGPDPVSSLTVMFPVDRIGFGDIAVGTATEYKEVPGGGYNYAAYSLSVTRDMITQPAIDWVGEKPLNGRAFTYTINVDARRDRFSIVRLMAVTKDD